MNRVRYTDFRYPDRQLQASDISEEVIFDQIWIKRTDHVKTRDQKIHVKGTESIKDHNAKKSYAFSAKKGGLILMYYIIPREAWRVTRSERKSESKSCGLMLAM